MHKNSLDLHSLVMDYNKSAIQALQQGNFPTAHKDLSKAKFLLKNLENTQKILKLKAITYNNFGCFYKKQGRLQKALTYLMQALNYESKLSDDMTNISGTYLNISIIYSEIDESEPALEYAMKAIRNIEDKYKENDGEINTLIMLYQNIGNLYVKMGNDNEGRRFLTDAYQLAVKHYGVSDTMTINAKNQLEKVRDIKKEKTNPVIEKMINYFEKHMGQSRSKKYPLIHNHTQYQQMNKDINILTHKPKQQSLQQMTDYQLKRKSPSNRAISKTPTKGILLTKTPKRAKFVSASPSKKSFLHQSPSKIMLTSKSKAMISQAFPSQQRLKVKSSKKPTILTKSAYPLIPSDTKIIKTSDKILSFRKNLSIFHKNLDDMLISSVLSNNRQIPYEKYPENIVEKAIIIQKYLHGYFARKKIKKLNDSARIILRKYRDYVKNTKFTNKNFKAKEFSQQFNQSILKKKRDEMRKPKDESIQTCKKTVKKMSFIEKIILIQRHDRDYLQKRAYNNNTF
ncbi:hypothetical protein SteCoe_29568 [Stentor coeruleus]|uniref:Uncharacterized protein n=1 Tax=Stentor coeruleus TaxID=5963 RepID=A0A1R2B5L9_9CILI|nr:hypothetical protein SteCoe_29568 [Stentor coeruleus]